MQRYSLETTAKFKTHHYENLGSHGYSYSQSNIKSFIESQSQSFNQPAASFSVISPSTPTQMSTNMDKIKSRKCKRVINFMGDIKSNMLQTLFSSGCCKNCLQQFKQIMEVVAGKLEKLRAQRDMLREKYINDVYQLQNKLKQIQDHNQIIKTKLIQYIQIADQSFQESHLKDTAQVNSQISGGVYKKYIQQNSEQFQFPASISFQLQNQDQSRVLQEKQTNLYYEENYFSRYHNHKGHNLYDIRNQNTRGQNQYDYKSSTQTQGQKQQQIYCQNYENIKKMAIKYNLNNDQLEKMITEYLNGQAQYSSNPSQIKKLRNLQNQLKAQRQKRCIRNELSQYLKRSLSFCHQNI